MVSINHAVTLVVSALLSCIAVSAQDTTFVVRTDTVYVEKIVERVKYVDRVDTVYLKATNDDTTLVMHRPLLLRPLVKEGKKLLVAPGTNFLGIPFLNAGFQFPINKNWSVGTDFYFPWFYRFGNLKNCTQFFAWDIEGRYWFKPQMPTPQSRLLGHSVGLYAAIGLYDFERNWNGHQGNFFNVGVDYKRAIPLFDGRVHLEMSIGFGFIYAWSQEYDCYGKYLYKHSGVHKETIWVGPTRAQISILVPIYLTDKQVEVISFWRYFKKKEADK